MEDDGIAVCELGAVEDVEQVGLVLGSGVVLVVAVAHGGQPHATKLAFRVLCRSVHRCCTCRGDEDKQ